MKTTLRARLDHVAVAVPDQALAERRWRDELGGGLASWGDNPTFRVRHYRFANSGKLELLLPPEEGDGFVNRFLDRFGAQVHHVTLMVPDLHTAASTVEQAGLSVIDMQDTSRHWQEFFLRPAEVGGFVVQVAWASGTDEEWVRRSGRTPEQPRDGAARLLGPSLRHPDLERARGLWTVLGAQVDERDDALRCTWPDSVLDVEIIQGDPAGPVGLRMAGTAPLPPEEGVGPAVLT